MKERLKPEQSPQEEIEKVRVGFEMLAQRLDELWIKDQLTSEEESEVELILNNASIIDEVFHGKIPEEFLKK